MQKREAGGQHDEFWDEWQSSVTHSPHPAATVRDAAAGQPAAAVDWGA
jgi:hypothetical protein